MAVKNIIDQMTALEAVNRSQQPDAFRIIECMSQTNEMLLDMPAMEANDGTVHVTLRRTSIPGGMHRVYNQGVKTAASQTKTFKDIITMLAAYSIVDKKMVDQSGNPQQLLMTEAIAFLNGMGIDQARDLIYGDSSKEAAEIDGLHKRYVNIEKDSVVSLGGTGSDLTSVFLVAVGPSLCHLIYPRGSKSVGVNRRDLGEQTRQDKNGGDFQAYVNLFEADYGISVRDPRAVKRICNIPPDATGADIVDKVLTLKRKLPAGSQNIILYANGDILDKIDKAVIHKENVAHTATDPWGREITMIRNIRCRQMDVILNTESQLT